jgi:(2Fe-2S) ferredoxin
MLSYLSGHRESGHGMRFDKHVFICINERRAGERPSCGEAQGMALVREFKRLVRERDLKASIRCQRAGCLDACDFGPSVAVYPEGVFYGKVTLADVPEIVEKHLVGNRPVERLVIDFDKP